MIAVRVQALAKSRHYHLLHTLCPTTLLPTSRWGQPLQSSSTPLDYFMNQRFKTQYTNV